MSSLRQRSGFLTSNDVLGGREDLNKTTSGHPQPNLDESDDEDVNQGTDRVRLKYS